MPEQKTPEATRPSMPKQTKKPKLNLWMITTFVVLAIFAASLLVTSFGPSGAAVSTSDSASGLPAQQVAEETMIFLNSQMMDGQSPAKLVNVSDKGGVYYIIFEVDGVVYSTYVSNDGAYLFPQVIDIKEVKDLTPNVPVSGVDTAAAE